MGQNGEVQADGKTRLRKWNLEATCLVPLSIQTVVKHSAALMGNGEFRPFRPPGWKSVVTPYRHVRSSSEMEALDRIGWIPAFAPIGWTPAFALIGGTPAFALIGWTPAFGDASALSLGGVSSGAPSTATRYWSNELKLV